VTDIAAGRLTFRPDENANGAPYATLTFQVQDDGGTDKGGVDLDPVANTLTFNVTPVADPVTVTDVTVNEASPFAVFKVTGVAGEQVALALNGVTATDGGKDFGAAVKPLQVSVDGGTNWVDYTGAVTLPAGGSFLVRTAIINDGFPDNGETFTLEATPVGGGDRNWHGDHQGRWYRGHRGSR
jgi:hypothetical protein